VIGKDNGDKMGKKIGKLNIFYCSNGRQNPFADFLRLIFSTDYRLLITDHRLPITDYRPMLLALCSLLFALSMPVHAAFGKKAVGTSGAQFLKLGVNARAIGMGEAYSAVADGSDAIFWNPAGLTNVENKSFSLMHAVYLQNIYYDFGSYALKAGRIGTIALSAQYLASDSINQTDEFGTELGTIKPYDTAISLAWAKELDLTEYDEGRFSVGVTGKWIKSKITEEAATEAADVGISWKPLEKMRLSLGARNLGPALKFEQEGDDLPASINAGGSYNLKFLLLALDVNFPRDNDANVSLGAEYRKNISRDMNIFARAGYSSRNTADLDTFSSVSFGSGIGLRNYSLDFAWVPFGKLGNTYRFSLSGKY